ncbi:alpha/beta fold hydrolase [Duganella callida]|uniref:Alpha/beta hydrolase n=1 Tax=Duganella callida TaxID=2561932 RepID=A0A4Y9SDP5_9BURK|nr:alpha/beta hydrolase [Duganella callida]TFW20626.1 alpha/beta hydrolase [Duganella callida]
MHIHPWAALLLSATLAASAGHAAPIHNIVLVHGAFADGSGWKGVADILTAAGYHVSVVQHPDSSLSEDVAATRRVLDRQDGPAVLVGHSYGGTIITEAGNHPQVQALVYVSAYAPDAGEDPKALRALQPAPTSNIVQVGDGFIIRDPATFPDDFAADVPRDVARFMAISQVATATRALAAPVGAAAWRNKPSWYIVSAEDRIINPELQRYMARRANSKTVELKGSHAVFIAQPAAVARIIQEAAQ